MRFLSESKCNIGLAKTVLLLPPSPPLINGHNLLILGRSGTWKIYLDNEIEDQLTKGAKVCDFFIVAGCVHKLVYKFLTA
jgi:hypothetical protein